MKTTFRPRPRMLRIACPQAGSGCLGCVGCSILNRSHGSRDRTLFDLTAPAAEADEPAAVSRSDELLAEIRDRRAVIAEQEIATLRAIAEWAGRARRRRRGAAATVDRTRSGHRPPARRTRCTPDLRLRRHGALCAAGPVAGLRPQLRRPGPRARPPPPADRGPGSWTGRCRCGRHCGSPTPPASYPPDAAAFVDRQIAPYAHGCTWAQVDRLVEEALVRFDPAAAEERRREAQEHRHVDLGLDQIGYDGIAHGTTALDAADALDLEKPSPGGPSSTASSATPTPSTSAGPKHSARSPVRTCSSTWRSPTPTPGRSPGPIPGRKTELILHISADRPDRRAGSATPAPRSRWSRSRNGSACPTRR